MDAVQGVGGNSIPYGSVHAIQVKYPEGQTATLHPYVMSLPENLGGLIGQDVLSQLGATLTLPAAAPSHF